MLIRLLLLVSLGTQSFATATAQSSAISPVAGKRIERRLAIGQKYVLPISLRRNQYVRFEITERNYLDLQLRFLDPNGKLLTTVGGADGIVTAEIPLADPLTKNGFFGKNSLEWIGGITGTYKIEINATRSSVDGAFAISIEELRPATNNDFQRVQAQRLFHKGDAERLDTADEVRVKRAQKILQDALIVSRDAGDRPSEAEVLNSIGICYWKLGDETIPQAREHFDEARKIWHELSDQQGESIATFNYLATSYNSRNVLATSDVSKVTRSSREIEAFLEQWTGVMDARLRAYVLTAISIWSMHHRKSDDAFRLFENAMSAWHELNDDYGRATALYEMGNHYIWLREFAKAEESYAMASDYANKGGFRYKEAAVLQDWGEVRYKRGEYRPALDLFNRAMGLTRGSNTPIEAYCYFNLGIVSNSLGDLDQALEYYNKAVPIWGSNINGIAYTLDSIGRIYSSQNKPKEALEFYERALVAMRESKDLYGEVYILGNIGHINALLGIDERALNYYNQALEKSLKTLDPRGEARTLNGLGGLYEKRGEVDKAAENYSRALTLFRSVGNRGGEANSLYLMSSLEMRRGDLTKALALSQDALQIVESLRGNVPRLELRTSYLSSVQEFFALAVRILMELHRKHPDKGFDLVALSINEQSRARSLLEVLSETKEKLTLDIDLRLLDSEKNIQKQLNDSAERLVRTDSRGTQKDRAALNVEIGHLTNALQQAQEEIRIANPKYMNFVQPPKLDVQQIQAKHLDADTLLLEYALGDEKSFVWLVSQDSVSSYEIAGRAEIEALSRGYYERLTALAPLGRESGVAYAKRVQMATQTLDASGQRLSHAILAPIAAKLGNKRLVIVADGALQYIPFGALPDPNKKNELRGATSFGTSTQSLIAKHEIVYLPSISTLNALRNSEAARSMPDGSVAVIADPVFELNDPRFSDRARSGKEKKRVNSAAAELVKALRDIGDTGGDGKIARLPATRQEAEAIFASTPPGRSLKAIDFDANYQSVTSGDLRDYRIVHFATHGILNNRHPELSGLVLSLYNSQGEPQRGFLRLNEIYNMQLGADLVVLSACRTGLGKDMRGEGLVGLTRGFMYAGARGVVASLWKVDDDATAELMAWFYRNMFTSGLRPAEALQKAQVEISKQKRWSHPYYWSGFVIQGEWK